MAKRNWLDKQLDHASSVVRFLERVETRHDPIPDRRCRSVREQRIT